MKCKARKGERESRFQSRSSWLMIGLSVVLLVACTTMIACAPKQVYIPVAERAALEKQQVQGAGSDRPLSGAGEQNRDGRGGIREEDISGGPGAARSQTELKAALTRDIYFNFDSYALKSEDLPRLKDLSVWLNSNKRSSLTVEGHCDERGSIEYNMALGQKRAEAVREYLLTLGVEKDRIKTISYGKETPTDTGHTEDAWAKNRRAHMKID